MRFSNSSAISAGNITADLVGPVSLSEEFKSSVQEIINHIPA
jgi:hypothetical protein